ncbi:MAG: metal-sulfur cluster assembly factor [Deltaproteobacteria bacterium]|nr:metal-sulfur cluster assembly factor [Deltaproteobacteria bacterium]
MSDERRCVQVLALGGGADPDAVLDALAEVIDPELGLDVVTLGLVYEVHLVPGAVTVAMTLTTPGCPLHGTLRNAVAQRVSALDGAGEVDVQLVWDPPWTPDRILPSGRERLAGLLGG